ncbi:MAG: ATP-binding protein [Planctomycetota bacterium]
MVRNRPILLAAIKAAFQRSQAVALVGARQCGKTTLARQFASAQANATFFDAESPADLARLANPTLTLGQAKGLVVIDEIQRVPELFPVLRVLLDDPKSKTRWLLLGSAAPELVRGVSETLAGRLAFVDIAGFDLREIDPVGELNRLWIRGGLPRSFLSSDDGSSLDWRTDYARTFLERDLPNLGIRVTPAALRRFWSMVAHWHGQIWSAAEFARALGSSEPTARHHLDILCGALVVRQLQPWHANLAKRQVKSPKIYVRDSGVLHALLDLPSRDQVLGHVKCGASWEGFIIEQILACTGDRQAWFWGTHGGAELDLLLTGGGRRVGVEIKLTDAPTVTPSMRIALKDLKLEHLHVIHAGNRSYPLDDRITATAARDLLGVFSNWKRP